MNLALVNVGPLAPARIMKEVPLTRGMTALVDDEDFDRVMQHKWRATPQAKSKKFKAATTVIVDGCQVSIYLHRFILGITDPRRQVDHKNRDTLDNQKGNLRPATQLQNNLNQGPRRGSSVPFKGVWLVGRKRKRFTAGIQINGKRRTLGYFDTPEAAATAYDAAARELHGEFAYQNFPQELTA